MRFSNLMVWIMMLTFLNLSFGYGYKNAVVLDRNLTFKREMYESKKFIYESFCKTCRGDGFDSLVDWQKTCKAMWKLDYIAWGKAEDFMIDENMENGELLYGQWRGPFGAGEIYCRK